MDPAQVTQLISGGGVLAFAGVVLYLIREQRREQREEIAALVKLLGKSLEILRVIEERTAHVQAVTDEDARLVRSRARTQPRGVPIVRARPAFDTDKEE